MQRIRTFLLVFYLVVFSTLKAQDEKDTIIDHYLDMTLEEILNTPVSIATKSEKKLSQAPSIVTVVTANDIRNIGARNIMDILQFVPGFEFSKGRIGFINVGVRGVKDALTVARVLLLKDGIPYNGIMYGSGFGTAKLFDINTIERIEIIRGPGSALYGKNAFSAVINIITKSGKNKNSVEAHASGGNFNTYDFGASYQIKKENFNGYFSAEKVNSDLNESTFDNGMGGESKWNIGYENLFFNAKVGFKDFTFTGMFADMYNKASTGPFITESDKDYSIGIYSLAYSKKLTENFGVNAKLFGRNEHQVQNIEIYKPGLTAEAAPNITYGDLFPNGAYATPEFDAYRYGTDISISLNIWKKHYLLIGTESELYGLKNVKLASSYDTYTGVPLTYEENGVTIFRGKDTQVEESRGWIEGNGHDYYNIAFYAQNIFYPIENLSITLGGRYDIDSEFGSVFNPRFALVWDTEGRFVYKLLYGQAYRAPNSQEQYRKTGFTVGNKNLKPEKIKTAELSVSYFAGKNINSTLTGFYNVLEDMIYAQGFTSGSPGSPYENIGENTSVGLEYEFSMLLKENFHLFLNYSYTYSENKTTTSDTSETFMHRDISPHKINFGINYKFLKHFNLNTRLLYRSEREKYFAINKNTGEYILNNSGNKTFVSQDKIGDYFLLNAKLRIFNIFSSLELSIEVYNLLNTRYYDQDTEYAHQPLREGRQFIVGLRYLFGKKNNI
jgi:outer membrane receptor for ferrienterochelin and colicins